MAVREKSRAATSHNCNIRTSIGEFIENIFVEETLKMIEENPGAEE